MQGCDGCGLVEKVSVLVRYRVVRQHPTAAYDMWCDGWMAISRDPELWNSGNELTLKPYCTRYCTRVEKKKNSIISSATFPWRSSEYTLRRTRSEVRKLLRCRGDVDSVTSPV
jgi:hypothetical protein